MPYTWRTFLYQPVPEALKAVLPRAWVELPRSRLQPRHLEHLLSGLLGYLTGCLDGLE
jgi:hypothetical protein